MSYPFNWHFVYHFPDHSKESLVKRPEAEGKILELIELVKAADARALTLAYELGAVKKELEALRPPKAKYHVGQVVMVATNSQQPYNPILIKAARLNEKDWFYESTATGLVYLEAYVRPLT